MIRQKYYDQVAEEIRTGSVDAGLWARAFAAEHGDQNKARAMYIRLRVNRLSGIPLPPANVMAAVAIILLVLVVAAFGMWSDSRAASGPHSSTPSAFVSSPAPLPENLKALIDPKHIEAELEAAKTRAKEQGQRKQNMLVLDAFQMPPIKPPTYVPSENRILFDLYPGSKALGRLSVSNGTEHNAIVKLIDIATNRKILSFYVRSNSDQRISAIPDGAFRLIFAFGDEIVGTDKFYHPFGFSRFESPLDFTTTELYDRTQYATFDVTLQPVIGGDGKTVPIPADEYDQY